MRATGSNNSGSKDLSILIYRGGLSFFDRQSGKTEHYKPSGGGALSPHEACAALEGYYSMHPAHKSVMVIAADYGTAVPEKLFDDKLARDYMECTGTEITDGQEIIPTRRHGMVFLSAIDKTLHERLDTMYRECVVVGPSALSVAYAHRHTPRGTTAIADVAREGMTLTLYHGKRLLFTDTLPIASHEDMVFYIERLVKDNGLDTPTVVCAGMAATATAEVLGRHYKVTIAKAEEYFTI